MTCASTRVLVFWENVGRRKQIWGTSRKIQRGLIRVWTRRAGKRWKGRDRRGIEKTGGRKYRWGKRGLETGITVEDSGAPREMEYANEEEWPPNSRQVLYYFFASSSLRFECFQKKKEEGSVSEPNRFRPNFFRLSVRLSVCQSASDRKKSFLKASIIAISPYDSCTTLYCTMQSSKIKFRFRSSCRNKSRLTCRFISRAQTRFRFVKELHQKWKIWSRDMRLRNTNLRKLRNELITMFFFYLGFYANIFE